MSSGMFAKDKIFAPDGQLRKWVSDGVPFVLWEIEHKGEVETADGPTDKAPMVWLTISSCDHPDNKATVSMVGDYAKRKADQRREAVEAGNDELPAVIYTQHVPSSIQGGQDAYVFTFREPYDPANAGNYETVAERVDREAAEEKAKGKRGK